MYIPVRDTLDERTSEAGSDSYWLAGSPQGWLDRLAIWRIASSNLAYYATNVAVTLLALAATLVGMLALATPALIIAGVVVFVICLLATLFTFIERERFLPAYLLSALASMRLTRPEHQAMVHDFRKSYVLRRLYTQASGSDLSWYAYDYVGVVEWFSKHTDWTRQIDELLTDPWVIKAEKALADTTDVGSADVELRQQRRELQDRLDEMIDVLAKAIRDFETKQADDDAKRRQAAIAQCLTEALDAQQNIWRQPDRKSSATPTGRM